MTVILQHGYSNEVYKLPCHVSRKQFLKYLFSMSAGPACSRLNPILKVNSPSSFRVMTVPLHFSIVSSLPLIVHTLLNFFLSLALHSLLAVYYCLLLQLVHSNMPFSYYYYFFAVSFSFYFLSEVTV